MPNKELFILFVKMFPLYSDDIDVWFPNGKDSIRIRMKNCSELIFTYRNVREWRLETIKNFLKNKGE